MGDGSRGALGALPNDLHSDFTSPQIPSHKLNIFTQTHKNKILNRMNEMNKKLYKLNFDRFRVHFYKKLII